jgi:hypothetical protein
LGGFSGQRNVAIRINAYRAVMRIDMESIMKSISILFGLLVPAISIAHHSVVAPFTNEEIQIEGVVTEFNFVNPHVNIILNITDENGAETLWMATTQAPDNLRRTGWSLDSIRVGQVLRVAGMKCRQGRPMILVDRDRLDDGGILELNPADGSVVRALSGASERITDGPALGQISLPSTLSDLRPNFTGYWAKHPSVRARDASPGRNTPPLNDRAKLIQAGYDPANDPSYTECAAHGLVRQTSSAKPLRITQYADRVVFGYEEGAAQRVVYLGEHQSSAKSNKTDLGYSIARYEGERLVIESNRLLSNLTSWRGNELSDQHTMVETYQRVDDGIGSALEMVMIVTDQSILARPWEINWKRYYAAEYEFTEVDCRLPLAGS